MVTLKSQHCPLLFTQPDILPPPTPGTLTPKKPPLWPPLPPPPSTTDQQCPQSPSRWSREASPDDCPKALRSMTLQKSQPHCTPLTRLLTPNPPTRPRILTALFTPYVFIAETLQNEKAMHYDICVSWQFRCWWIRKSLRIWNRWASARTLSLRPMAQFSMQVLSPSVHYSWLIDRLIDWSILISWLRRGKKNKIGYGTLVYR